jgi:ferrochelatase
LHAGGERYEYISALNDRPEHISALADLLQSNMQGWQPADVDTQRQARAMALGAEK